MGFCCTLPSSPSSSIWEMSLFIYFHLEKKMGNVSRRRLFDTEEGCNGLQIPQGKGGSLKSRHGALVFLRAERQKGPRVGTGFFKCFAPPPFFLCRFHVQGKLEGIIKPWSFKQKSALVHISACYTDASFPHTSISPIGVEKSRFPAKTKRRGTGAGRDQTE